jgi:hypothetical protein
MSATIKTVCVSAPLNDFAQLSGSLVNIYRYENTKMLPESKVINKRSGPKDLLGRFVYLAILLGPLGLHS